MSFGSLGFCKAASVVSQLTLVGQNVEGLNGWRWRLVEVVAAIVCGSGWGGRRWLRLRWRQGALGEDEMVCEQRLHSLQPFTVGGHGLRGGHLIRLECTTAETGCVIAIDWCVITMDCCSLVSQGWFIIRVLCFSQELSLIHI